MKRWTMVAAEVVLFLVIAIVGFGSAVLHLWNWLMPDLFRLPTITFWQAVGLIGLSWILFRAGFLGRPRQSGYRSGRDRLAGMTAAERDELRRALDAAGEPGSLC